MCWTPAVIAVVVVVGGLASPSWSSVADAKCGALVKVELGGARKYFFRRPKHAACHASERLPLVLLVHCLGCTAVFEIEKFALEADAFGFALAAPEGIAKSFNAPHCCVRPGHTPPDDVGLVDDIVAQLVEHGRVLPSAIFASGFSNGGFLTSHMADPSVSRTRWAAIAPTAGHEYSVRRTTPIPVFMHHCAHDLNVKPEGCCARASAPVECCCGIGDHRTSCVSTASLHGEWLRVNGCTGHATVREPSGAWECTVGLGCAKNATLCMHSHAEGSRRALDDGERSGWSPAEGAPALSSIDAGAETLEEGLLGEYTLPGRALRSHRFSFGCTHSDWARSFPASRATMEFFAQTACVDAGGELVYPAAGGDVGSTQRPNGAADHAALGDKLPRLTHALGLSAWRCRCPRGRAGPLCLGA